MGEKDDTLGKEAPRSSNIAYTLELRELKAGPSVNMEQRPQSWRRDMYSFSAANFAGSFAQGRSPATTLAVANHREGPERIAVRVSSTRNTLAATLWPANTLAVANHREPTAKRRARRFAHAPHGDSLRPKCSPAN
uniref:Uncharacterized protein n=1 Tax=Trichuris muris TaxID=70415 RepID=A0A5S6Q1R8_TRIMR